MARRLFGHPCLIQMTSAKTQGKLEGALRGIKHRASVFSTGHALLRDRYRFRSRLIEIVSLISSACLVSLAFADAEMVAGLIPWSIPPIQFMGILAVSVFCLTLLQLAFRWGPRADAHGLALENYAAVTKAARLLLGDLDALEQTDVDRLQEQYEFVNSNSIEIPDKQFLALKQAHLVKVEISKMLDERPGMNLFLTRLAIYWRDIRGSKEP